MIVRGTNARRCVHSRCIQGRARLVMCWVGNIDVCWLGCIWPNSVLVGIRILICQSIVVPAISICFQLIQVFRLYGE